MFRTILICTLLIMAPLRAYGDSCVTDDSGALRCSPEATAALYGGIHALRKDNVDLLNENQRLKFMILHPVVEVKMPQDNVPFILVGSGVAVILAIGLGFLIGVSI